MNLFDILANYHQAFFKGLSVTLQLAGIIWLSGILMGTALGLAGSKFKHGVGLPTKVFSFLLSGVPILVFLFWLHYPGFCRKV